MSQEGFMQASRQRVNARLWAAIASDEGSAKLQEAMIHACADGGKRIRPLLAYASALAVGGSVEQADAAATAVELIHCYSLVHDDLPAMDDDAERRGKPTVHVAFGEDKAILVGDALLTLSFGVLAGGVGGRPSTGRVGDAVAKLAHHAGIDGMVGGQALDLVAGQDIHDLELLERVHALKTGGLYAASAAMAGMLAGKDDDVVGRLERYGLMFGIAFQHADDVLDDDQPALREKALARTDDLVAKCIDEVSVFGEAAEPLRAIARWVGERAHTAAGQ
jgi:geranylgeranyl pyrophosphate synthase